MCYNTVSVSDGMGYGSHRGSDRYSGVLSGGGHHGLAGGHGELVLYRSTGHLGDGVTVLNLHRDLLDLRVVHTVLSGDLTASMLHSSSDGVGHSMSNGSRGDMVSHSNRSSVVSNSDGGSMVSNSNRSSGSKRSTVGEVLRVSLSFSISISDGFSLPLAMMIRSSITQSVHNLLAHLLILNLLGSHNLSAANFLRVRGASLSDQDDILSDTVRSGSSVGDRGSMSIAKGLSFRIS